MMLIQNEGIYLGPIKDSGVNESSGGYPQFVVQLEAKEVWNGETWEPYETDTVEEMRGYLILADKNENSTFNATDIKTALGWSGKTYGELNFTDYSDKVVQFRVTPNTYQGKTKLQVASIAHKDADPNRTVKKLDKDQIKSLDAKYGAALRTIRDVKKSSPASAAATTAPKTTPKRTRKGKATVEETAETIWNKFAEAGTKKEISDDELTTLWDNNYAAMYNTRNEDELSSDEWAAFGVELATKL